MTIATLEKPEVEASTAYPRRWLGLFAILGADLMNLLDSTVGTIAGPSIRADLGGSLTTLQWIVAGYALALAVGLLTGGRLGDIYGRKRMLMIGVGGFIVASLVCAVSVTPAMLIVARVAQGAFGALMVPQSFGLIREMFGKDVGKAFAALGPVIGLATVAGPVVAGLLIDADFFGSGWRAVFLVNIPFGLVCLILGAKAIPDSTPVAAGSKLDVRGALIAGVAMTMLVYPLVQGHELGWPVWMFALLAGSLPVFALFVRYQLRTTGAKLVELSVFGKRSYAAGVAFVVAFFGAICGFSLATGLFLQMSLGYGPLGASLAMLTWAIGAFVGSVFGGTMTAKLGRKILHLGLGLMIAGLGWMVLVFASGEVTGLDLALPQLVFGFGMGMIFVPLFDIIVGNLADHEVGSAAGMLTSFQQLGASLGVAVLGTMFFSAGGGAHAAAVVALVTVAVTAVTFLLGFLLPKRSAGTE